jgi:hypothetical protein
MSRYPPSEIFWSEWCRWDEALGLAPREPGVYMARHRASREVVYIGMAGERGGSRGRPQGLRGRLAVYTSGKALASGLGEAVLDRALADPEWLRQQLAELEANGANRAKQWGVAAFVRADLEVRWSVTPDAASARALERDLVAAGGGRLWNRVRSPRVGLSV